MTVRTKGIDVSSWQHPAGQSIDWEAAAADGVTFALVKATQGVAWVNPWAARDIEDAFAAGLLVGAYHYFDPSADPTAQARHMVGALMGLHLDLGAWLDFEPPPTNGWTAAGWVNTFLEAAKDGRPGCGLYCDQSWWTELAAANVTPPALWLAAPDASEPPPGATLWQAATGIVAGVPGLVDVDWLVGTRGVNLPTGPKPRPTAGTTTPVHIPPEPPAPEPAAAEHAIVRDGELGPNVVELQEILNREAGANLVVDGEFGPETLAAVMAWQHDHGLAVDGVVGPATWASLDGVPTPAPAAGTA